MDALERLDGRPYGSYKSVVGTWEYGDFTLRIDRIQADPYAPPSALRVITTPDKIGLSPSLVSTPERQLASSDFLVRAFHETIRSTAASAVQIARPGQEILERSACTVRPDRIELRFQVHMPARGRSILGRSAAKLFDWDVPNCLTKAFAIAADSHGSPSLRAHIDTYEDYLALQEALLVNGWISFVANDAVLARRSGISQHPMVDAVPFVSPKELEREVVLPHAGAVRGMALQPGVTVIVGGGYHGKSTLLSALQRGVHPHIPGDGRELVVSLPDAMKVRAADGRAVTGVDVSPFITHLPGGADTTHFSTENASGSTSQAAAIMEAVELGSRFLLVDEDTSATNLLIRDARMRSLVENPKEPITPLVDRIGALSREAGVSTVMVMGGSGDYLDIADRVLMLDNYRCRDVTEQARGVVASQPREHTEMDWPASLPPRMPVKSTRKTDRPKTRAHGLSQLSLDKQTVDLFDVEQIADPGQTEAIAWALRGVLEYLADGNTSLPALLDEVDDLIADQGLDALRRFGARDLPAFLVRPRRVDIGAALNRYRALRLNHSD
ncbi:MAG: ABC-ATPase domain-containing protein [Actinomycetaceae bacterium]|nr:ABC-ATPase domain-containing protein [Actinomycetaceae bacterium]